MEGNNKNYVRNFWDLDVYKRLRVLRKVIILKVIPKLPKSEKFDLGDQMSRACKGACAILAEGFAKRFQIKHWQKYLTDSVGECDEMIDHLIVFQDVYFEYLNKDSIQRLIDEYHIAVKQLVSLGGSWGGYHKNK
jgi:four helix bundle protein